MYKYLLCWRYLRTRWIALASIISVMLGVATMIVVNSVMQGFAIEMQARVRGSLSDVLFRSGSGEGLHNADAHMEQIRQVAGDDIESMSPAVVVPAMLSFEYAGNWFTRQVDLVGIDERTQSQVSDFGKYLQHEANRRQMSFELRPEGYDTHDHQCGDEAPERPEMREAGWVRRRKMAEFQKFQRELNEKSQPQPAGPADPFQRHRGTDAAKTEGTEFDPARQQHTGVVLGIAMASYRKDGADNFIALPGEDVKLTFPTVGMPPKVVSDNFTIVDLYESKMSEFDSKFVFVPIRKLQELRGMIDPTTGVGRFNLIQIKVKPGVDGDAVRDKLRAAFHGPYYVVSTWRDEQGPILKAVDMETAILNVLLFMIIAVAGFGILAIFYMIVLEKTHDIGVLKSLGASGRGVMGIFLSYGLSLGIVGSGVGMIAGLVIVRYINEIADFLGWITGRPVFNPDVYYFYKIPAVVLPQTVAWIVAGALAIAVLASVLPARRAARLHPVEALRYE